MIQRFWGLKTLIRALASAMILGLLTLPTLTRAETPLRFIAIGDMPYSELENNKLKGAITQAIANADVPFVVHYGDFKGGSETCTEDLFRERRDDILGLLPGRVFYTPGDNEWTDCDRAFLSKPVSELGQLDLLRRLFFATPLALPASWTYARQPLLPENARWVQHGVLFATVHLVGTNNGRKEILRDDPAAALAFVEARDQANRVWLQEAFSQAEAIQAKAVVIITQADVTKSGGSEACSTANPINCDAFAPFRSQLIGHAKSFGGGDQRPKPVLLIHGDTAPYCLDTGFGGDVAPNVWRLNAWGDFQSPADATAITVQPHQIHEPFMARTLLGRQQPTRGCP